MTVKNNCSICPIEFLRAGTYDIIVNGIRATSSGYYFFKCRPEKVVGTQGIRDNLAVLDYIHFFKFWTAQGSTECSRLSHIRSLFR